MNTQPETNETLQAWVTPRLQRLNQADGTDKHLDLTESVGGVALTRYYCSTVRSGSGGAAAAGAVCGPS